jgi:predicted ATPase/class 3 adenylate cyclase
LTLPTGTLTFLFTDIEGSTRLMVELGDRYPQLQMTHHELLRKAFQSNAGHELRTEGDSFFCVFASALDACTAAAAAQRSFKEHEWPEGAALRVRIGLHTGEAPLMGGEYIGLDVHHAARIAGAANGGQVLLSESTRSLVQDALPADLSVRDLGMHRLKDLARPERVYQLVVGGLPDTFPALKTLDATPNNLPTQLTSFIGRSAEVEEAGRLLGNVRLLTLTGPGGTGKTRLSLQIAADAVDEFPDGVYFVPLSAVSDADLIPSAIALVLGIPVSGSRTPLEMVIEHLRDRKVLLVLDNFEQLLPAAAGQPSQLLQATKSLKVMVSSRAALRAYGEQEYAVQPLHLPDLKTHPTLAALSQFEAVKLFIERALTVKPDFQATNENAPAIAGICERVDGLPLAIELAAARVKLFSPQALLTRLEKSLSVLGTGARDLPGRQQTLQGAIGWSYDLLEAPLKRLMARFSVFARGAEVSRAESICGPADEIGMDVLTGLDELADSSLLRRQPDYDEPRVVMLQTIREFATERLEQSGEAELLRNRHAVAFQALADEAVPNLFTAARKAWLDRLELDHDNFRGALDWCVASGNAERAMLLGASLWRFWQMRGHLHEGRSRLTAVLSMPGSKQHSEARRRALEAVGGVAYWQGDLPASQIYYDECLELTRSTGDRRAIAGALYNDSFPKIVSRSDVSGAQALLEEALPIYRELDDTRGVAGCLWGIGQCLYFSNSIQGAVPPLEEAIGLYRKLGDGFGLGWALFVRALVALRVQDVAIAGRLAHESLQIFSDANDISGMVIVLANLAESARLEGDPLRGARLAGAAEALRAQTGTGLGGLIGANEGWQGRETLSEEAVANAWAEGQAMSMDRAVAYALGTTPPAA